MGFTTDFIGHVDVAPSLNQAEQAYLTAFSESRRYERPGGPYEVPGNPQADWQVMDTLPANVINKVAANQPGYYCRWVPCWDGCCLSYNGDEKFYDSTRWLNYLIEHFLRPGAYAEASGLDCFREFTFDHQLDGVVAGCRRDNKELFLIRVHDGVATEEVLRRADPRFGDWPQLPYETQIDNSGSARLKRRMKRRSS